MRNPAVCLCENKDADHLRGNRDADQRLCFHYIDSTIPLLPQYEISSLYPSSVVCVRPGRKPRRPVFSQRGSKCFSLHTFVRLMTPIFWLHDVTPYPMPTAAERTQSMPSTNIPIQRKHRGQGKYHHYLNCATCMAILF